jgi:hypothetical protein
VDSLSGSYDTKSGVLTFSIEGRGAYLAGTHTAVFDADAELLSLFFGNEYGNRPPLALYAGKEVKSSLLALAALAATTAQTGGAQGAAARSNSPTAGAGRARGQPSTDVRSEKQALQAAYLEETRALQAEVAAARKAKDKARVKALTAEIKALNVQHRKNLRALKKGKSTSSRTTAAQPTSSSCPAEVLAWSGEMTRNGASRYFVGPTALANLFRPQLVREHFGKSFDQWSVEALDALAYDMQRTCMSDRNEFATGATRIPLTGVFYRPQRANLAAMAIAGIALENAADWKDRSLDFLEQDALLADIDRLESTSKTFVRGLWPNESQALEQAISQAAGMATVSAIENSLSEFADRLDKDDFTAIHSFHRLKTSGLFERLPPNDLEGMKTHYFEVTTAALERSFTRFRQQMQAVNEPRERLDQTRNWWQANPELSMEYFSDLIDVDALKKWFGEMREADWRDSRGWYKAEFAKLDYVSEIYALFDSTTMSPFDAHCCKSWKDIGKDQWARIEEIRHEQYVARVGEGPYTAEHPGAVYLNAIYRNDKTAIFGENLRLTAALRAALHRGEHGVYRSTYTQTDYWGVSEVLFDGVYYRDPWGGRFVRSITSAHLLDPMIAFLAITYSYYLPHCVNPDLNEWNLSPTLRPALEAAQDPDSPDRELTELERARVPQIYRRALKDLVERVEQTQMAYKPGTLDKTLVVRRYVDVFNTVWTRGEGQAVGWMYFSIFNGNWERAEGHLSILNGALQGLRELMEKGDCDDPVLMQLEENIQSMYNIK